MTEVKLTIKEYCKQTDHAKQKVKSAIHRKGLVPVGSRGQEFLYYLEDLNAMFKVKGGAKGYLKKVMPKDERPDGSVTIQEFIDYDLQLQVLRSHGKKMVALKYHTVDTKLRRAGVSSDGFVVKGSRICKTYPLTEFNRLFGDTK